MLIVDARIREARQSDSVALAILAGQLGYPTLPLQAEERLRELRSRPEHAVFVAEDSNGNALGWVHVFATRRLMVDPFAELGGLVVDEEHRAEGIGGMLLEAAEAWARKRGLSLLRVRSNTLRQQAALFYAGHGYTLQKTQNIFAKEIGGGDQNEQGRE
jgi:GNAT superfamily N-acetyltransferase